MIQTETTIWQRCGHLGGPAAAVEEALPPAGPGGGGAQPALAAVIAVVDSGVAPGAGDGVIETTYCRDANEIVTIQRRPLIGPFFEYCANCREIYLTSLLKCPPDYGPHAGLEYLLVVELPLVHLRPQQPRPHLPRPAEVGVVVAAPEPRQHRGVVEGAVPHHVELLATL